MATLYLVALTEASDDAWRAMQMHYPNRHQIVSATMAFVVPDGISTAAMIKDAVGIDMSDGAPSGIVVQLDQNRCSGVLPGAVVDWIRQADD